VAINGSARKHGVSDDDIVHAVDQSLAEFEVGDDDPPRRWLVLGPNRAGVMVELIVLVFDDGGEMVIHAMPMRSKYEELLPGGES
jgi:hypothetical protein